MSNHFSSYKNLFKIASKGRVLLAFLPMGLMATGLPSGHVIKHGQATITQTPTETKIEQSTTGALIEWDKFSVPSGHAVVFNVRQDYDGYGYTVNRVVGNEKSAIAGRVSSNGTLVLTNPNGILIEKQGSINTTKHLYLSGYDIKTLRDNQHSLDNLTFAEFGEVFGGKQINPMENSVINLGEVTGERSISVFGADLQAKNGSHFTSKYGYILFQTGWGTLTPDQSRHRSGDFVNENRVYTINTEQGSNFSAGQIYFANLINIDNYYSTGLLQSLGGGEINPQDMAVSNIAGNFLIKSQNVSWTTDTTVTDYTVYSPINKRGLAIAAQSGTIDNINISHVDIPKETSFGVVGRGWRQDEFMGKTPVAKLSVGKNIKLDRVENIHFDHKYVVIGDKDKNWANIIKKTFEGTFSYNSERGEMRAGWHLHIDPLFFSSSVFEKSPKAAVTFDGQMFWDTGGTTRIEPILDFSGRYGIEDSYVRGQFFLGDTLLELKNGLLVGGFFKFSGNSRIKLLEGSKAYEFKNISYTDHKMEIPIVRTKEEWEALSITEPNIIYGDNVFHHQIIVGDNIDFGGETIETKEIENQQKKFEVHGLGNKLSNFIVGGGGLFGENENRTDVNNLKIDGKVIAKNPGQSGVGILHSKVGHLSLVETDIKSNVIVEVDNQNPQKHAYIGGVVGAISKRGLGLTLNNSINTTIRVLNKTKGNYEKNSGWDEIKTPLEKLGDPSSTKELITTL